MNISFIFIQLLSLTMATSALENDTFSTADDLEAAKSSNQIQLSRKKRDDCTVVDALNILENGINVVGNVMSGFSGKKGIGGYIDIASSIVGLSKSIFDLNAPSTCDLDNKLDAILSKLTVMIEEITNLGPFVECKLIEQNYRDVSTKIKSLLGLFRHFYQIKRPEKAREAIISRCQDHDRGIHEIYHAFTKILEKEEVVPILKNCAHYQSDKVNVWVAKIKQTAFTIMLLVQGCEEAYNGTTQFDPTRFLKEVEEFTQYYSEVTNLEEFVKDTGNFGLRNKVKSIANKAKSAEEIAQTLKKLFNYFNWDVIVYPSTTKLDDQHWLSDPNNTFCGSVVFRNESNDGRNALIAWCISNNMNSDMIKFVGQENAKDAVKWMRDQNENVNRKLNYVLVYRVPDYKWDTTDCDCNAQIASGVSKIAYRKVVNDYSEWYINAWHRCFCSFASWTTCSKRMDIPQFRLHGIVLGIGGKVITNYDAKFEGHYTQFTSKSDYECFEACKSESQCAAASFYAPWLHNCLFFREGFRYSMVSNWISYIKNGEAIKNIPEIKPDNDTRLSGHHYKDFISESDYTCFQQCKNEELCAAASFNASDSYNCYFFEEGFTISTESNWTSYMKNYTRMVNTQRTEKNKCNLDITLASNNDTRLFGRYYKRFTSKNDSKCFWECISEAQCAAATFYASYMYNCFFFKEGFTRSIESDWSSYIKNEQSRGN